MANTVLESNESQLDIKKAIGERFFEGYSSLKVNIKECETHVLIEVETPGILKKNISMDIESTRIEIRASTTPEKETYNGFPLKTVKQERILGKFKRVIELPCKVNINEAVATYHEGVLYIEVAKPNESINIGKRQLKLY